MRRAWVALGLGLALLVVLWWRSSAGEDAKVRDPLGVAPMASSGGASAGASLRVARIEVSGRVTRKRDGTGIANAVVSFTEPASELQRPPVAVATDGEGRWTAPIAPGRYAVAAQADGFVPGVSEGVVIAAGSRVDLALEAGGWRVSGTVSDLGGGAVPDAWITVRSQVGQQQEAEIVAIADATGSYRLTLPDATYYPKTTHEDYASAAAQLIVAGAPVHLDFTLVPEGVIRGTIIASDTKSPVPGALVEVRGGIPGRETNVFVVADADGRFALRGLGPGTLELEVTRSPYATIAPTIVELGIGEHREGVRVELSRGFTVSGHLTLDGVGIAGMQVTARRSIRQSMGASEPGASEPSDATGAFSLVGLTPGRYQLQANDNNLSATDQSIAVFVTDRNVVGFEIPLTRYPPAPNGISLRGHVSPPVVATVEVHGQQQVTTNDGAFHFAGVPSRDIVVRVTTEDGRTGNLAIDAPRTDLTDLVVSLSATGSVSGIVVDEHGTPMPGVWVALGSAKPPFLMPVRQTTTSRTGHFQVTSIPPGRVRVYATDESAELENGWGFQRIELDIVAGVDRADVQLVCESRNHAITGTVTDASGAAVADAWVTAQRDRPKYMTATDAVATHTDGTFAIEHLRDGAYNVVALGPRGSSRGEAHVRVGEPSSIRLASLGAISGRVTSHGAPVTRYQIQCLALDYQVSRVIVADDGSYRIDHVAPGRYACSAEDQRGRAVGQIDVADQTANLDLEMIHASMTGTLVSVFDGKPIEDAVVMLETGRSPEHDTHTDVSGRFTLERVPPHGLLSFFKSGLLGEVTFDAADQQQLELGLIKVAPPRTGRRGYAGLAIGKNDQVTKVFSGDPADLAGVRVGDTIVAVNGVVLAASLPSMADALLWSSFNAGDTVQLGLARGVTVSITMIAVRL